MNENEFPILKEKIAGKRLIYLDNAATSQKPKAVIDAVSDYYGKYNSNVHRSMHQLSEKSTEEYENARKKAAKFINADANEIIFTKGATESINIVARGLKFEEGDEIVLTIMEHHANIVPWQIAAQKSGAVLKYIPIKDNFTLDIESARKIITEKTRIVSVSQMSNVLGTINDAEKIARLAHSKGALVMVDAAQSAPTMKIDVKKLDCDFLAFSSHKMLGPTGVGVLYGKKELLEKLPPFVYGGKMISEVGLQKSTFADVPQKFEAGTPNIAGVIGFGKAIGYIENIGMEKIREYETELTKYAIEKLQKIKSLKILGPSDEKNRGPIISFHIEGMHSHDISELLAREGVAIRGGHHCAMPLMKYLGIPGCARISLLFYNTKEDVDIFAEALQKAMKIFGI